VALTQQIAIVDAWCEPEARAFFRNVWPLYVHEISSFDSDFYQLDATGRWQPDLVEDWISSATPVERMRETRTERDPAQPVQRTHVITSDGRAVGFACIGVQPFKYMPDDVDLSVCEFFMTHAARGTGAATRATDLLLRRYPGRWHLSVIHDNARALRFWRKTLPVLGATELVEQRTERDVLFSFIVVP
jgi:predicted acetyltransferase